MRKSSATLFAASMSIALSTTTLPAIAQGIDLPARKPGQWEIKTTSMTPGAPPDMIMEACVDATSDAKMMQAGLSMSKQMCPDQTMTRDGDAYVIDTTCMMGPMTTRSHIVITGDFQSAYTVNITVETTGEVAAMAGTNMMKQEAHWVGAECSKSLEPGDVMMPGETKMNVDEMMKMMGGG